MSLYLYTWGNNAKRVSLRGRTCRLLARGRMRSCLVEFTDNGQREIVDMWALRKEAA